jgi:hypothetical protein
MGRPYSKLAFVFLALASTLSGQISSVALSTSANPSVFGASVTLTATVTPSNATGKVTFYDGAVLLGVRQVSGGQARIETTLLGPGVRTLGAYYTGDSTHVSSNAAPFRQTVRSTPSLGFQPAASYPVAVNQESFALGDFNGDGKIDLAVASPSLVSICLGAGDGTFTCPHTYPVGLGLAYIGVADFNGDGNLDVAVVSQSGYLNILLGNGDGTLQPVSASYPTGPQPATMAVADLAGDGIADLIVVDSVNNNATVFMGIGDGTFYNDATYPAPGVVSIAVGDFNGDGKPDLAVGEFGGLIGVFLGNGNGSLQPAVNYEIGGAGGFVVAGDFNGDGILDLAAQCSIGTSVLLGNGDGTFQPAVSSSTGNYSAGFLAVADFNGDGKLDLAVPDANDSAVVVLLGNGDGTFRAPLKYLVGDLPYSAVSTDFNGDGRADLAVLNSWGGTVGILLGQANSANPAVSPTSVSPASGAGYFQIFAFTFSDTAGAADLATVSGMISNGGTAGACGVTYNRVQNTLALLNDSGALTGAISPGGGNQQNSQCVLVGSQSGATASGNVLTLTLAIGFKPSQYCCSATWGNAVSSTGSTSGWQRLGWWTVATSGQPPQAVSVQPTSGSAWSHTFTFVYSDQDGATDLSSVQALVNASQTTASACYLSVDPVAGSVSLASDSGTGWLGPVALGSPVTLQNSQCSVNVGSSAGAISSGVYTLQLALTFAPGFAGAKNVYAYAASRQPRNSGWQKLGTWTAGPFSRCDPLGTGSPGAADVQQMIDEALGTAAPANDLTGDGIVNVVDVQIVIDTALGMACPAS